MPHAGQPRANPIAWSTTGIDIPSAAESAMATSTLIAWESAWNTFVMERAAVIRDISIGLLIAGAAAAWMRDTIWQHLFLTDYPLPRRSGLDVS